ncbi:slr1306 family protein [Chroococcidiopsis sp.]|uniref:slr1306 family protein n=1 Tax=Chroococcidiopsis sp. TaxID=3088168 RepID=UPI003F35A6CE
MLQRPILIGGVGLAFALWFLQGWQESLAHVGEFSLMGAIAIIFCMWLLGKYRPKQRAQDLPVNRETVEKAIAQVQVVVDRLETENYPTPELREKIAQLETQIDRQEINLAITGGKSVGKTTLLQVLETQPQDRKLCISETAALFSEVEQTDTAALQSAIASDLTLFVTSGDLTDSEYQTLQQLLAAHQRLILVFNKQDQYLPDDRAAVLYSLGQKMQPMVAAEDVVAIASAPNPLKVRQHQTDGAVEEWLEQRLPEVSALTQRLEYILQQEAQQLVWATTKRQAEELKAEGKVILDRIRRDRALPVVEQYQWIAAAAAFANPVPALDLLATAAINAQLVMELGAVYQQKFSFEQAQNVAGTMGSLMLKLGLVELSTKAISTVLKTNAVTFVAGGAVQGVSAAYLTRLAGCSLIEYFQQQEEAIDSASGLNLDKLGQTLQNVFQQNQQVAFLQGFVKQGLGRLLPTPQPQA